jgi:nudix-type nucleoside diphosphatase (YffH/AdpP family)
VKHKVNRSKIVFNEFFKIERAQLTWERFDGSMGVEQNRYVIRRGDSVGIVPVCEDGKIVLVKQFRYATAQKYRDGFLWEVPAGMVDGSENPLETAVRELREEVGIDVREMHPMISFFLSPGALDEKFYLFFARVPGHLEIGSVGGNEHEHENLKIEKFDKDLILEMIERNDIADAKTVASLLYYFSSPFCR